MSSNDPEYIKKELYYHFIPSFDNLRQKHNELIKLSMTLGEKV